MDLTDRGVLVTGGRRIGAVIARELGARGADVAVSYNRSRTEADETVSAIRAAGRRAVAIQADLARAQEAERLVSEAAIFLGRLDILINMASVYVAKPFDALTEADWDANLDVDLKSYYFCARAAVPHMRQAGTGRIISFSDWLAYSHRPRYKEYLPYYVAKAGVIGLTEALALELAEQNILVNAIAPGPALAPKEMDEEEKKAVERATPLGRWGGEMEFVKAVLFLIESDFITGEIIRVDGGRHVR